MEQLSFDELLKTEMQESEKNKPWFLQISSASLVRFNGDKAEGGSLSKGTLGKVVGTLSGEFDTAFSSGHASRNVKYIDLEPMKVTEFTDMEKQMKWPKLFEYVQIVSNATMQIIDEGYLISLYPDKCCLTDKSDNGDFSKEKRWHDLIVHHFKNYEPKRM
ncbi:hypothetical protein [Ureibacillus sp. FSL K6-0165]|uniref:hypothetical protein n=1 Tax=Ureibacillus sp. FSL K6-0165 TaxID=2954606 RepID=UPI0030F74E70